MKGYQKELLKGLDQIHFLVRYFMFREGNTTEGIKEKLKASIASFKKTWTRNNVIVYSLYNIEDKPEQFSLLKAQRMYLQGKGGCTGPSHWNMRRLGICGAAPPLLSRCQVWGSSTAYSKATGRCHPFFQEGNSTVLPPL